MGGISIARRWSRAAAASEGVASERSETRRPEPLVGIKKVIGTRETGDRNGCLSRSCAFCHPFHGFHVFYYQKRGFRLRPAGYAETGTPLAMDMSPTYVGYKFRSLSLANCSPNSNLESF